MTIVPTEIAADQQVVRKNRGRKLIGLCAGVCVLLSSNLAMVRAHENSAMAEDVLRANSNDLHQLHAVAIKYQKLQHTAATYSGNPSDVSQAQSEYPLIWKNIKAGNYARAEHLIQETSSSLQTKLQAEQELAQKIEAAKGTVQGVVRSDVPLGGCTVTLLQVGTVLQTAVTDSSGAYSFKNTAGTYSLKATLSDYQDFLTPSVVIAAGQNNKLDIVLVKNPPPTPIPTPTPSPTPVIIRSTPQPTPNPTPVSLQDSTSYSTYRHTSVTTSSGIFTADIMTFDLGSGHIKVMEDTADDGDCANNCSVKSVMNFVQQDGGFAGINGTYFCPTAYGTSCAGKTNSFYWKQYNSRVQKMINPGNLLGEQDPFIVFDETGHATFLQRWVDFSGSGLPIYAGISCKPAVVINRNYAVDESTLDTKQLTAKISRGAIGLKDQTLFVVTVQGATVMDLGQVMQALGMDNAMNVDAGGSSGMVYKNSYKLGPGRAVPNALVFLEH